MSQDSIELVVDGAMALDDAYHSLKRAASYLRSAGDKVLADKLLTIAEYVSTTERGVMAKLSSEEG